MMRQEGLAKRVVEALFLDSNSPTFTIVRTPATVYLPIDDDGEPYQDNLAARICPDVSKILVLKLPTILRAFLLFLLPLIRYNLVQTYRD